MTDRRPEVVLASTRAARDADVTEPQLERLRGFADFRFGEFDRPTSWDEPPPPDPDTDRRLIEFIGGADALVVCHGSPRITGEIMDAAPNLRFIGELEGDRFARRIDVEAAWERGIKTVDTTNGSSYGVAEWALAMTLIGLRNAGSLFRAIAFDKVPIESQADFYPAFRGDPGYKRGELSGKTVGLIGCGIIGRRLLELLEPFHTTTYVYDPYVPRELADVYDVTFTSLDNVLSLPDVVICLAPITPATKGMLGAREFGLMRDDAVFVNVSRGAIVQTDALIARLREGTLIASLDVFDPEPIPLDSPVRDMPNVFLTPHIAGVNAAGGPRFFKLMVDELERFLAGHETRYDLLPRTIANRTGQATVPRV
jgi:phosphoglycerate dehydrogenase-like enzyme